ncbi:MAG: hypothetical protein N2689_07955 [Verrucomicrobiae bacterium]|nr:hypothetical protein [Verrucomicrobiae bacterium]
MRFREDFDIAGARGFVAGLSREGFTIDLACQLAKDPLRVGTITLDISLPPGIPAPRKEAVKRAALQCTVRNTLRETTAADVEIA